MKAILDDNPLAPWCGTEPATLVLDELEIRPALPAEMQRIATLLNGIDLPAAYQPGCDLHTAECALPLKKAHLESLRDALHCEREVTISHYLSSLIPQAVARFAHLERGHWGGCEIRNHWVRDVLFKEDATLSKNLNLNGNLAVMRCAVIALKARHVSHLSWPTIFELSGLSPAIPYNMVCNNALK